MIGVVVAVLVIGGAALGVAVATWWRRHVEVGDDHEATTTTIAATTTVPPTTRRRSRSRRSPGCPTRPGASHTRPALTVKVENTPERATAGRHRRRPTSSTKRSSRATSPGFLAMFHSTVAGRRRPDPVGAAHTTPTSSGRSAASSPTRAAPPIRVDAINAAPVHAVDENARRNGVTRCSATSPVSRRGSRRTTSSATAAALFALGGDPVPPPRAVRVPRCRACRPARRRPRRAGDQHADRLPRRATTRRVHLGRARRAPGCARTRACRTSSSAARRSRPRTSSCSSRSTTAWPNGQTVGEGDAWVFTRRHGCARGALDPPRPRATGALRRRARACRSACVPGRTWVELLPVGVSPSTSSVRRHAADADIGRKPHEAAAKERRR